MLYVFRLKIWRRRRFYQLKRSANVEKRFRNEKSLKFKKFSLKEKLWLIFRRRRLLLMSNSRTPTTLLFEHSKHLHPLLKRPCQIILENVARGPCSVWPDLAKFCLSDNILKIFGNCFESLLNMWQNVEPCCKFVKMILGTFSLSQMCHPWPLVCQLTFPITTWLNKKCGLQWGSNADR